jgi:uncharacterized protein
METLAGDAMTPETDLTGRSFASLDQAERDRLATLLRPLPWIDGLVAAVAIAPDTPDMADEVEDALDWLDVIWREEKDDEVGKLTARQSIEMVSPVMDHFMHVSDALGDEAESYRPYLAGYSDPLEAASQWAAGFCGGISLYMDAWEPLLADEDALPLLFALFSLVREEELPEDIRADSPFRAMPPDRLERMRREAVETLPEIVRALNEHALGPFDDFDPDEDDDLDVDETTTEGPQEPYARSAPKVGRNDPCPCGSGKKYKKCCLGKAEAQD